MAVIQCGKCGGVFATAALFKNHGCNGTGNK